jgi:hypothetical protein
MTTFTEVLPATLSNPHAGIDWTPGVFPGCGVLSIKQKRCYCSYVVTEFACGWDGRAFRMRKVEGQAGSDAEGESYDVFCHRGRQDHRCDCKGFEFGRGKPCKHVLSALALIENGWLDLTAEPAGDPAPATDCPF